MSHGYDFVGRAVAALVFGAMPPTSPRRAPIAPVLQLTPASVAGGNPVNGTVSLAAAAPSGGTTVTISTSSLAIAPLVNPRLGAQSAVTSLTLVVPQGQTSATFRINTPGVATVATATISAAASGEATNAIVTVVPASVLSVAITPTPVTGGQSATAAVTLDGKAPPTVGAQVTLSARITTIVQTGSQISITVPPSVTVSPGASSANFSVTTTAVPTQASAIVSASLGRSASTTLPILPPSLVAVQLNPVKVIGGSVSTGTVVLNATAPPQGVTVTLTSSSLSATVASSVTVPGGVDRQTFAISTTPVSRSVQVKVTAQPASVLQQIQTSGGGTAIGDGSVRNVQPTDVSATLIVDAPPTPSSIVLSPSLVIGGKSASATVVLTGPAPAPAGVTVLLSSSSADAVVPASITVPAGADRQTFQITTRPVVNTAQVTISARGVVTGSTSSIADGTSNTIQVGSGGVTSSLSVLEQARLQSVVVQPSGVAGGTPVTIAVTFSTSQSALSPEVTSVYAGTIVVSTNHPELLQLPTSFSVAPSTVSTTTLSLTSGLTATATAATNAPAADQTVSLTALMGTTSGSTSFIVRAAVPPIAAFTLRPTTATGGTNIIASLTLSSAITTSQTIQLTTDHPEIVQPPSSVIVAPGRALSLTFSTRAVTTQTTVTLTAIAGTQRMPVSVVVVP